LDFTPVLLLLLLVQDLSDVHFLLAAGVFVI
jgi:hypothetical protein